MRFFLVWFCFERLSFLHQVVLELEIPETFLWSKLSQYLEHHLVIPKPMLFKFLHWTVGKCLSVHWGVLYSSKAVCVVCIVSLPFFKLLNKLTNLLPLAQLSFRYIHLYSFKRSISFWDYLSANCAESAEIFKVLGFLSIRTFISCHVQFFTFVHLFEKVPSCLCPLCENLLPCAQEELFSQQKGKETWHGTF